MTGVATMSAALASHLAHLGPFTTGDELARLGAPTQPGLPSVVPSNRSIRAAIAALLVRLSGELSLRHLIVPGPELVMLEAIGDVLPGVATTVWLAPGVDTSVRASVTANLPRTIDGEVTVAPELPRLRERGPVALVALGLHAGFLTRVPAQTKALLEQMLAGGLQAEVVLLDPLECDGRRQPPGFASVYTARTFTRVLVGHG